MNTLVVLLGPTGTGKTEISYALAEHLGSPIVSADSRQLYRETRIGTAAPTPAQLARCPHYFIGTLSVTDYYSAARYEADVLALAEKLFPAHPALLMVGGSMMYIDAVCQGIDDIPTVDADTRTTLLARYQAEGLEPLANELRLLDPEYYATADIRNPKRVLHALEICYMTGRPYTSFRTRATAPRPFRIIKIGLERPREELYERINARVTQMMDDGLLEEARNLYDTYVTPLRRKASAAGSVSTTDLKGSVSTTDLKGISSTAAPTTSTIPASTLAPDAIPNALNTVGYRELFDYFDGLLPLNEAIEKIRQHTRIYSRKQMTWFRRDPHIHWFHPSDVEGVISFLDKELFPCDE